jgi:hypothetical protein
VRVSSLLTKRDAEIRRLAKYLYEHDYLNYEEMDLVIKGQKLTGEKEQKKVRTWNTEKYGNYLLKF